MKTKLMLLAALFGLFGFSCQKSEAPTPDADFSCDKQAKVTSQVLGDIPLSFEYDAKGRLSKYFLTDGKGLVSNFKYTNDTTVLITRNFPDGRVGNRFGAILTPQGYLKKYETLGTTPDLAYGYTYTYDGQGRLKERIDKSNYPVQTTRKTYVYEGGNLKSTQSLTDGKPSYSEVYRYTTDVNKVDLQGVELPGTSGVLSANLLESIETTYANGKKEKFAFTYELNKNGFVKSQNQTYTDQDGKTTSRVNKYAYVCQ